MELTSLVTGPARMGIALSRRALAEVRRRFEGERELDDVTLARKVETVIFRGRRVSKGKIDVNAAGGVVWLRGEAATPDLIAKLEAEAAAIPEVKRVESLLHLPKPPPRPEPAIATDDDTALTRRVETELFREGFAPKGKVTVNTAEGVVFLRGEADSADRIRELEAKAAAIPEVKRVENQLQVPSPPAPFPSTE